ncbi:hypothetical protein GCM10009623_34360 [Nocardioides aestuarii]|uniref:Uncharacterized protein n=1 Tax=Nocardioides aestuarii TaxID=252231 RepID=A0ABW4TSY8_9ACTN
MLRDDRDRLDRVEEQLWRYATQPTEISVVPFPDRGEVLVLLAELHRLRADRPAAQVETLEARAAALRDTHASS